MGSSGAGQTVGSTRAGGQDDGSYTLTPSKENRQGHFIGDRLRPTLLAWTRSLLWSGCVKPSQLQPRALVYHFLEQGRYLQFREAQPLVDLDRILSCTYDA